MHAFPEADIPVTQLSINADRGFDYHLELGASREGADVLVDGYAYGSLSMTAYTLGMTAVGQSADGTAAAAIPADLPPDGVNI